MLSLKSGENIVGSLRRAFRGSGAVFLAAFPAFWAYPALAQSANPQDSLALVAFYHKAGGLDWTDSAGWLEEPVMGWHGVTLNEEGRVVRLALEDNNLTGAISSQLGRLAKLQEIRLGYNELTGPVPASLGRLSELQTLWLGHNDLTGSIPPELGNLAELDWLHLEWNALTGPIPASLGNLAKLNALYLGVNRLTGPIPPELGHLAELRSLHLYTNRLTGSIPASLGNLAKLNTLLLGFNRLTGPIPPALSNLVELRYLTVWYNALTGPIPAWLGKRSRLRQIGLGGNALTGSLPPSLGNLANLEELSLFDNPLAPYDFPAWITDLGNLKELNLARTRLRGAIPSELFDLPRLEQLDLAHNDLEGAAPGNIANAKELRDLDLSHNHLNALGDLCGLLQIDDGTIAFNRLTFEDFEDFEDLAACPDPGIVFESPGAPDREALAALFERTGFVMEARGPREPVNVAVRRRPDLEALRRYIDALDVLESQGKGDLIPAGHLRVLPRLYRSLAERAERFSEGEEGQAAANIRDFVYAPQRAVPLRAVREAGYVTFSVEAGGEANAYQWYRGDDRDRTDDAPIAGATSNVLRVALSAPRAAYYCEITNPRVQGLTLYSERASSRAPEHIVAAQEPDSLALVAFYHATGGAGWKNDRDWLRGPLGSWYGVSLNATGRVTGLDLAENNLTGRLPKELGALAALEKLHLRENRIAGAFPEDLGKLTSLASLDLGRNFLGGPLPASWGNLIRLRELSLNNNGLAGPIPEALGKLTLLERLDLASNHLIGPVPAWLGDMTRLIHLDLTNNSLTDRIPEELGNLAQLELLSLDLNELTGPIPPSLGRLGRLEELFLGRNALEGAVPDSILALRALERLDLSVNRLTSLPDITGMPGLRRVHVGSNRLTFEAVEQQARFGGTYFVYAPQAVVPVYTARSSSHVTFSVEVGGTANAYQWYREGALDDEAIPGATADTLAVPLSALPTRYHCEITNAKAPALTLYSERGFSGETYTSAPREDALAFAVHPNYPNPFSEATEIAFDAPEAMHVRITVYDALGRSVETLLDRTVTPGRYRIPYAARNLAPGTYFYHVAMGRFSETRTMILVR